eukprot:3567175-Amphidinium_carterae.2
MHALSSGLRSHLGLISVLRQLCNVDPLDLCLDGAEGLQEGTGSVEEDLNFHNCELPVAPAPIEHADQHLTDAGHRSLEQNNIGARGALSEARSEVIGQLQQVLKDKNTTSADSCPAKLELLHALLTWCRDNEQDDAIVIVSTYVISLERCREVCNRVGLASVKLTGATPAPNRLDIVNRFNEGTLHVIPIRSAQVLIRLDEVLVGCTLCQGSGCRVLLLSAHAGGCGLNIVGANRMVVLEPEWNPAVDMQVMGRIGWEGCWQTLQD